MRTLGVLALSLSLVSCIGKDIRKPGESLGFFDVVGTLGANTCGEAPSPWTFRVELRKESVPSSRIHWAQGDLPVSATLASDGSATFQSGSSLVISPPSKKSAGCTVVRSDTVALKLAPNDLSFDGTLSYAFAADEGSECTNVSPAGIENTPCNITYTLRGVSQGPTPPKP
jgi:hypothetical protein